jgi:hypothetical protein
MIFKRRADRDKLVARAPTCCDEAFNDRISVSVGEVGGHW